MRAPGEQTIFCPGMAGGRKERDSRMRRRTQIRYGVGKPEFTGFSGNMSTNGLMIRALRVFEPGTVLELEVQIGARTYRVQGSVRWAREGSAHLLHTGRIGMGIKFIKPSAEFIRALAALDPAAAAG